MESLADKPKTRKKKENTPDGLQDSFGVILIAFGHYAYYEQAYNLAFSIKTHSPDVKIALHAENIALLHTRVNELQRTVFDEVMPLDTSKFNSPAAIKLGIYDLCVFDRNLYLDVDTIALRDISPIFEVLKGNPYLVHVNGGKMLWMDDKKAKELFNIDGEIVSVNSSIQYIEKGKQAQSVFDLANQLYKSPVPNNQLKNSWGTQQPDELYLNIALTKLEFDPSFKFPPVLFTTKTSIQPHMIEDEYYFLSYFGPKGHTPYSYVHFIDAKLKRWHEQAGQRHTMKVENTLKFKHANTRPKAK